MWPLFLSGFFQLKDLLPEGFQGINKNFTQKHQRIRMKYQSFGMAFIGPGVSSDRFPVNDSSCETMVGKPRFSSKRLRIHPGRIYANRDQI